MSHTYQQNDSPCKEMVIIASISTIVTILIRNHVMIQLGVTTVQLFLKVSFALFSKKNSHEYFEWSEKGFHCFCPDGTSGAPYVTSQGCYDVDEDRWSTKLLF